MEKEKPVSVDAPPAKTETTIAGLKDLVGTTLGPSSWRTVTQDDVDRFADVTGDHNPIHLDPEFARKTPFGQTIAHGYLTLSLMVPLMEEIVEVTDLGTGINYGLDRLRFPAPVPVGTRIRVSSLVSSVKDVPGGVQVVYENTCEGEGQAKPVAVSVMVVRYYA